MFEATSPAKMGGVLIADTNLSEPTQSLVSVLIRVRNEEYALRQLFECLRIQKLDRPFEVVVIDNESDDGSAKVARAMGARVFTFQSPPLRKGDQASGCAGIQRAG